MERSSSTALNAEFASRPVATYHLARPSGSVSLTSLSLTLVNHAASGFSKYTDLDGVPSSIQRVKWHGAQTPRLSPPLHRCGPILFSTGALNVHRLTFPCPNTSIPLHLVRMSTDVPQPCRQMTDLEPVHFILKKQHPSFEALFALLREPTEFPLAGCPPAVDSKPTQVDSLSPKSKGSALVAGISDVLLVSADLTLWLASTTS